MSRAPAERGAQRRATGVYKGVHEDGESLRNAAMASAVVSKTASEVSKAYHMGDFPYQIHPGQPAAHNNLSQGVMPGHGIPKAGGKPPYNPG